MTYWVSKEPVIQKVSVFERKILRKISGPTKENQTWRVKTNYELDKLTKHKIIINYIKSQRLSWFAKMYQTNKDLFFPPHGLFSFFITFHSLATVFVSSGRVTNCYYACECSRDFAIQ
jgi:hypothetical protein